MKLQIMDSGMLDFLKDPKMLSANLNKYADYENNKWIYEICPRPPFIDTKFDNLPDLVLDMSADSDRPYETEFENVKRVYSTLKFLSDSTATDERLWAALALGQCYDYVRYRWKNSLKAESGVYSHFFLLKQIRRGLTRNAISRLWWLGRLTYDKDREVQGKDPYELTSVVCKYMDFVLHITERNTSNNLHILRPFLEAFIQAEAEGITVNTDDAGELEKYLQVLGGIYILDYMPEEWIKDKILKRIHFIADRSMTLVTAGQATNNSKGEIKERIKSAVAKNADKKAVVKARSKVTLEPVGGGNRIQIVPVKLKRKTTPSNIVGLKVNDKIIIGKTQYIIIEIK